MYKNTNENGITLVTLVVTIILLLILAGVTISYISGGGIIDRTQVAMDMYENADKKQQGIINEIDEYMKEEIEDSNIAGNNSSNENTIGGGSGGGPEEPEVPIVPDEPSVDSNGLADKDITITTDYPNVQIVIPEGFAPVILKTGRTDSLPGENGAVKEIMPVKDWNSITAEQINKGIVVVDHAITYTGSNPDFNEYVWIPITDSSKFVRNGWGETLGNEEDKNNKYWEETSSEDYTKMMSSVSINKGFYISRYEASQRDSTTAQSKRGQYPWTDVSQLDSITASSNMKASINSHLIYGIEWDSVFQWLLDSNATIGAETSGTRTITRGDMKSDSSSWGNYKDSVGGAATNSGGSAKAGGTNEYWKVNNIYDLAGNVSELTQEKYSTGTNPAVRGGAYDHNGVYRPAAYRDFLFFCLFKYSMSFLLLTAYIK